MADIRIALASEAEREILYRLRHEIYARELGQHRENPAGRLRDALDDFNLYITAAQGGELIGFISITPPERPSYSVDKYCTRDELPFPCDAGLYEVRLLTVLKPYREGQAAGLLMYAAFRWVQAQGGTAIMAIGRREILDLYCKVGLQPQGLAIRSGAVDYELLWASVATMSEQQRRFAPLLRKMQKQCDWHLDLPFFSPAVCFHGGAFFAAVGEEFEALERSRTIINADVLDAWFPPAPRVIEALHSYLPWLLRTSPPTQCEGLIRVIARSRGVRPECVLPGAGSSALIFLAFRQWLSAASRVLILDPTYGEYAHLLEQMIGCRVDRLALAREENYALDLARLKGYRQIQYDLIVLVNPNNPTGQHVPRETLEQAIRDIPARTRVWIDETYSEYAGSDQSLERFAAQSPNVVVCKSLSKVYALSGLRVAYLCAAPMQLETLRAWTPPWAVSLPAQVGAVEALQDPTYYAARWAETHALRRQLIETLHAHHAWEIVEGVGNSVLCHLPPTGPNAATVVERCRSVGLFLRDASTISPHMSPHSMRITVKDAATNRQIVALLTQVLREP
jgi:histidinol-phosphate/aromatic aminotransferase/cobyric acid decarboxylase-like protein